MKKFWCWVRDETNPEERTLRLEGAIAEERRLHCRFTDLQYAHGIPGRCQCQH